MKLALSLAILATSMSQFALANPKTLAKIDRTIKREPTYAGKPTYMLLVFGPKATHRVWAVLDGDTFYVDLNGNGDLTEPSEKAVAGKMIETPGLGNPDSTERILWETMITAQPNHKHRVIFKEWKLWEHYGVTAEVYLDGKREQSATMSPAKTCKEASIAWYDGPLTMCRFHAATTLARGDSPTELSYVVGIEGLGTKTTIAYNIIPEKVLPTLSIEYPAADGKSIKREHRFDHRC